MFHQQKRIVMRQLKSILFRFLIVLLGGMFSALQIAEDTGIMRISPLKESAYEILEAKCNTCHRKQNPFKVFSYKNMEKHAPKIYKQVFVKRRMPKGDEHHLTKEEYDLLEQWLLTQNIP